MATLCAKDNEKLGSDQWVKEGKAIVGFKPSWWVRATSPDGRETIGTLRQRDYKGIGNDDLESGRGLAIEIKDVAQPQYFESHPNDSRVTGPHDVGSTVSARYGTGGGNTPIVSQPIAVDCFNQTINEKTSQTIGSSASDVNHYGAVLQTMAIRRLTPKECERLQGFPDDWTKIPYRNKPADQCPDGPRYKACGNSMAVPVMRWIGTRIQMIENYLNP
jgi:site-specific DNA-cytosine methylase